MSRIRSVHPGIYTDEAWASVSILARWLGVGLCTEADDNGVFEWKPLQIKMRIFPADSVDVKALLAELTEAGIVTAFDGEGRAYGALKNFCKYQRPRKPKAWHPLNDAVRAFVALGSEPVIEPEEAAVPQKSEPTPVKTKPIQTKSEKSPQMEDGGGRREEEISDADASSSAKPDKSTVWDEIFLAAWEAYPHFPGRSASRAKCWPVWREQARLCGSPEKLLEAVKRFAKLDKAYKGAAGAKAFERWLRDGRWEHWIEAEDMPSSVAVFPAADVRAEVESARGATWCASWLDPCTWDEEHRTIIPRTNFAAAKLRQEVGDVLRGLHVRIEERAAA